MATEPQKANTAAQALVKVEKLTQIAFALPVAALAGWFAGAMLDRALHTHWLYIVGLVAGVAAGFVLLFRMIAAPGVLAETAYDPQEQKGPGFGPGEQGSSAGDSEFEDRKDGKQ